MTEQPTQSPHIAPAVEEEQRLLQEHMQQQQARYLMNRCVALNVAAREAAVTDEPTPED